MGAPDDSFKPNPDQGGAKVHAFGYIRSDTALPRAGLTQVRGATGSNMGVDVARFLIFMAVSLVVFVALLRFVTRRREQRPRGALVAAIAALVVVGGMVFAKYGNSTGLPWWIYYTVPALAMLVVPASLRFWFDSWPGRAA